MVLDTENHEPTAAELDAALVFTAAGYSDGERVDHVTKPHEGADAARLDDAMARAERTLDATLVEPISEAVLAARAAADASTFGAYTLARSKADHEALSLHALTVRSEGLRKLIRKGIALKLAAEKKAAEHERAATFMIELKKLGGEQADVDVATLAEALAEGEWTAAREELDMAALRVSQAPFANIEDVLARADAYARLVGTRPDNRPDCDEDVIAMGASYRQALEEMARRLPGADEFGDASSTYRNVETALLAANRELEARERGVMTNEEDVVRKVDRLSTEREEAQNAVLAERPASLDDLLVQMEVVFDQAFLLDVETYAARHRALTDDGAEAGPLTVDDLRTDDGRMRALALLATSLVRLRDKDIASDWRDLVASFSLCHPNAPDALWQAYDAGMDVKALSFIQLTGRPEGDLPTLTFQPEGRYHMATPQGVWTGEPAR